ncbi:MAG TPA: thioredoxin domain-containing protein [Candidatus Acidoferrales bacterium]|nr:thioredoxin domain-containing protein [Candidatus Acidoferrales bacterium]
MSEPPANRLKNSVSPYLRSAAHQPVDWHEWGEGAFAKARAEAKPILLDIGAVWCHWCHVIDRESYENPEIAALINQFYVAVKVDRDERPDVDSRYQAAVSSLSGQGGWPLTAFLTPDGKPFFGGTYFPPEDAMGRPGFKRILVAVAEAFRSKRSEIDSSALALEDAVRQAETFTNAPGAFDPAIVQAMAASIAGNFDPRNGGFGQAPKFPHPAAIDLLLELGQASRDANLLLVANRTLEKMALGGAYDQLAGGFHRYSVDERWCVPHFEKMSYDNSELLKNYLHAFQVSNNKGGGDADATGHAQVFRATAEGIIGWVFDVMTDREHGGFYASQDADISLDDDGDYFTWTLDELRAVLTPEEARVMEELYDVGPVGEMHHSPAKNVLWVASTPEDIAKRTGISASDVRLVMARAKGKMLAARAKRTAPAVDQTVYVGWNAMFVSAFLEAARVLRRDDCREFALKTLERILAHAWDEKIGFCHRVPEARASSPSADAERIGGLLEDQVFAAAALLDAYEATLDRRYFALAERTMQLAIEKYGDAEGGGFFDRASDAPPMGGMEVRRKAFQDSPTPSTNSAAAIVLGRLYGFTGNALYREWAQRTLEAFAALAPQFGLYAATYGLAAVLHSRHTLQVVITGATGNAKASALEAAANSVYRFGKAVLRVTPETIATDALAPALKETIPHLFAQERANVAQAYVCVGTSCHPPVSEPAKLIELLTAPRLHAAAK